MTWLIAIALLDPAAHARPSLATADPAAVAASVADAGSVAFETQMRDDFPPKFQAALLETAFPKDAARIAEEVGRTESAYRVRAFARVHDGSWGITAANGRIFTLAVGADVDRMRVNGEELSLAGQSFDGFANAFARALHRTFVARHWPWSLARVERAEAMVPGLIGALVVGLYVLYTNWPSGDPPARVTEGFTRLARVCTADRAANRTFEKSATGTAYLELLRKEVVLNVADEGCASKIAAATGEGGRSTPRFTDEQLKAACAARAQFTTCAQAYRAERGTSTTTELRDKSTPAFN